MLESNIEVKKQIAESSVKTNNRGDKNTFKMLSNHCTQHQEI